MRRDIAFFGGVFAAGLAVSAFLVPSRGEFGLMLLKDREFAKARAIYEPIYEAGDHSANIAMPLVQLYLELGEVEKAIGLTEAFVEAHPDNLAAWRKLAGLHQYGQMPEGRLRDLEAINRLAPDGATLRELASLYDFGGRFDDEIVALAQLAGRAEAQPQDYVTLAYLQAFRGKVDEAVSTMDQRALRFPADGDANAALLAVSLLMKAKRYDDAVARAEAWLGRGGSLDDAVLLAAQVAEDGHSAAGLRLLEPYQSLADGAHPDLLTELTWLELSTDHGERALSRLVALAKQNQLPPSVLPQLIEAALFVGQPEAAFAVLPPEALQELPNELIVALGEAAVTVDRADLVRQALAGLSPAFKSRNPVLVAWLALAIKDGAQAASWVERAEASPLLPDDEVALTELLIQLGRPRDALARFDRMVRDRDLLPAILPHFAATLAEANLAEAALPTMQEARETMPSLDADRAWAVVALKAGRLSDVHAWLDHLAGENNGVLSDDVYTGARDAHLPTVALLIAKRMFDHDPSSVANRLNLAEALSLNRRWREAEPLLKDVRPALAKGDPRLIELLTFAFKAGAPVGDELRGYWRERYAQRGGSEREDAFQTLVDLGDYAPVFAELEQRAKSSPGEWLSTYAEAATRLRQTDRLVAHLEADLDKPDIAEPDADERMELLSAAGGDPVSAPYLRRLADRFGQDWVSAYEESLTRMGRRAELVAYLEERGRQGALPAEERRDIAGELLDLGDKAGAEAVYRDLAAQAAPDSEDVKDLLYLWGPQPKGDRAGWLAKRLADAPAGEKAAWLAQMVEADLPAEGVAAVDPATLAKGGDALVQGWTEALAELRDPGLVEQKLRAAMKADGDPQHLTFYAAAAYDSENWDLVQQAYGALADLHPGEAEWLHREAEAAIARNDVQATHDALRGYLRLVPQDAVAWRDYGDAAMGLGDRAEASAGWQSALDQLDRAPAAPDFASRRLRAELLQRLERPRDAAEIYSALLAERPDDLDLKADLSDARLDAHQYEAAKTLLQDDKK